MPHSHEHVHSPSGAKLPLRLRRFALTIIPILLGLHCYIAWRLLGALALSSAGMLAGGFFLLLSTLLIIVGMFARFLVTRQNMAEQLAWAGSVTMGLFSSFLVLTFLRDLFLIVETTPSTIENSAIAVPILAVSLTLVGFVNARQLARVVVVKIPVQNLPHDLHGFTIVQLSDIHVGPTIKREYVQAIVNRVNQLGAEVIAITGDIVDGSVEQLSPHTKPLAELKAQYGVYVVTGNHEYYSGAEAWIQEFKRLGLQVLMNEHVLIKHNTARLVIAGVTDFSAHAFDPTQKSDPQAALVGSPEDTLKILLAHQPRSAPAAEAAGFDIQLSGHTHGGQFWPWNLFVFIQQPFTAGLHRLNRLWVYTSRGTGYWGPPKRFGAPSEITLIELVPAPLLSSTRVDFKAKPIKCGTDN